MFFGRHRFHDISAAEEVAVLNSVVQKKTNEANSFWDGVFNSFCREKQLGISLETCSAPELAHVLKKYYGRLRKQNDDLYQPAGSLSARALSDHSIFATTLPSEIRPLTWMLCSRDRVSRTKSSIRMQSPIQTRVVRLNISEMFSTARILTNCSRTVGTT